MAFADEIVRATEALGKFADAAEGAARAANAGGGGGGLEGGPAGAAGGGGFLGRAGSLGKTLAAGAGIALAGANVAFGRATELGLATGDAGFEAGINQSALSIVSKIPFLNSAMGASATQDTLNRAAAQASNPIEQIARFGGEVSDEFIEQQVTIATQQQNRIQRVRERVATQTFGDENINRNTDIQQRQDRSVEVLERILERLTNLGGGA